MVSNQNRSLSLQGDYEKAQSAAWYGYQQYQKTLSQDADWSNQVTPVTGNHGIGTFSLDLSSLSQDSVTIQSTGRHGAGYYQFSKTVSRTSSLASDITVDLSGIAYLNSRRTIANIDIQNLGQAVATWSASIVSWSGASSLRVKNVGYGVSDFWDFLGHVPVGSQSSSVILNPASPVEIQPGGAHSLSLDFNEDVFNQTIVLYLTFSDGSSKEIVINAPDLGDAGYLSFDTSGVTLHQYQSMPNRYYFSTILVTNTHSSKTLTLDTLTPTWVYVLPNQYLWTASLQGAVMFLDANPDTISGETVNLTANNARLSPGQTKTLAIGFETTELDFRDYAFLFTLLDDGSSVTLDLDRSFDMATQLGYVADTLGGAGSVLSFDLINAHSSGNIWLDDMRIDVDPDVGQTLDRITVGGQEVFSVGDEPDDLGIFLDLDVTTINRTATTVDVDFNTLPTGATVDITFRMVDGTTTQSRFLLSPSQSESVGATSGNAYLTHQVTPHNLFDVYLSNTGDSTITFVGLTPSWAPDQSERIKELRMDGTKVFQGANVSSGQRINFSTTYAVSSGQSVRQRLYSRGNNLISKDFSLEYHLSDGSSMQVDLFWNVKDTNRWVAADNFEDGTTFDGGGGFTQNWQSDLSAGSAIQSGSAAFSGRYYLRLRKKNWASRRLSVAGLSELSLTMKYRIRRLQGNNEKANVQVSTNGSNWTTIHTYQNLNFNGYRTATFDLSSHIGPGNNLYIKFELDAQNNQDQWFIDEVYFHGS